MFVSSAEPPVARTKAVSCSKFNRTRKGDVTGSRSASMTISTSESDEATAVPWGIQAGMRERLEGELLPTPARFVLAAFGGVRGPAWVLGVDRFFPLFWGVVGVRLVFACAILLEKCGPSQ